VGDATTAYAIYEGAALLLSGAEPTYLPVTAETGFGCLSTARPGSGKGAAGSPSARPQPHRAVMMQLSEWRDLFEMVTDHGFVSIRRMIFGDLIRTKRARRFGALQAATELGRPVRAHDGVRQHVQAVNGPRPSIRYVGRRCAPDRRSCATDPTPASAMKPGRARRQHRGRLARRGAVEENRRAMRPRLHR